MGDLYCRKRATDQERRDMKKRKLRGARPRLPIKQKNSLTVVNFEKVAPTPLSGHRKKRKMQRGPHVREKKNKYKVSLPEGVGGELKTLFALSLKHFAVNVVIRGEKGRFLFIMQS